MNGGGGCAGVGGGGAPCWPTWPAGGCSTPGKSRWAHTRRFNAWRSPAELRGRVTRKRRVPAAARLHRCISPAPLSGSLPRHPTDPPSSTAVTAARPLSSVPGGARARSCAPRSTHRTHDPVYCDISLASGAPSPLWLSHFLIVSHERMVGGGCAGVGAGGAPCWPTWPAGGCSTPGKSRWAHTRR
jgi:hypothetical protein